MKELETNNELKILINEFETILKKIQWGLRNFFDEYYNDQTDKGGGLLNTKEIKQKYDAFRKAKSRNKINIYDLRKYIKYIQNHDDLKKTQYVYANYIPLDHIETSTERMLKKLSKEYTNKVMKELDET